MNTRRKFVQAKPDASSTKWHLMNESFYPLFEPDKRERVEYWYNMVASGLQRDIFRRVCNGIYQQDPSTPDPTFAAAATEVVEHEEVRLLLKNYGLVLSDDVGKPKTRAWLLHCAKSRRERNEFRSVFTGCQSTYERLSVMRADLTPPEPESYPTDRTHFVREADWTSAKTREQMQELEKERRARGGVVGSRFDRHPTIIAEEQWRMGRDGTSKPRITKPKNQFDGVNVLSSLGFDGVSQEEAVAQLRAKRDAEREKDWYYTDKDGSTVYKARSAKVYATAVSPDAAGAGKGGILSTVTSDPMTRWVNKTCS